MNRARYILYSFILLIAFLLYIQTSSNFQKSELGTGEDALPKVGILLMDTMGDIKIRPENSKELRDIRDSEKIYEKDTLISANQSTGFLFFPSETSIKFFPNTEIVFRRLSYEKEGNIDEIFLKRGAILIKSTKRKMNDHFTIITPSLVIGVRGLEGKVEVNPVHSKQELTRVVSFEGNILITQHRNEVPLTSEPICILSKDEMAVEEGFMGNIDKVPFDFNEYMAETLQKFNYSEADLVSLYHRNQIDKISLKDGRILRGILTDMNDSFIFLHSMENFHKISKDSIRTMDVEKIKMF